MLLCVFVRVKDMKKTELNATNVLGVWFIIVLMMIIVSGLLLAKYNQGYPMNGIIGGFVVFGCTLTVILICKMKYKLRRHIVTLLVIANVFLSLGAFVFLGTTHRMETSYPTLPGVSYEITSDNCNYTVKFTKVYGGTGHALDVDVFNVVVMNDSQVLIKKDFRTLLNNFTSNLTFLDNDDNEQLSKGDELIIRGDLAINGKELLLVTAGSVIKTIPLE